MVITEKSFCDLVFNLTGQFLVFCCSYPDPPAVPKALCFSVPLNMQLLTILIFFSPFSYQIYPCHFKALLNSGNLFRFIDSESFVCLSVIRAFIFIVITVIKNSCQVYNIFYARHTSTRISVLYVLSLNNPAK